MSEGHKPKPTEDVPSLQTQVERLLLLHRVGISLSAEKNKDRLVEMILLEAKALCNADGGTVYLRNESDLLEFDIFHTDSLGLALGGTSGKAIDLPPVPLRHADGSANVANIASYAAVLKRSVRIDDAYDTVEFDFSGVRDFDRKSGYRSQSFLTIPMVNHEDRVIGVLQLLNAQDERTGGVIPFQAHQQWIVEALASQAAVALDNQLLRDAQDRLFDNLMQMIASAIDAKSPYTGAHCERVPIIAEMLVQAACAATDGPFKDFELDDRQWRELRVAAWLHDCGKIVTPVHVMDKATKLEGIFDRIELVRLRFEILRRDAEIAQLRSRTGSDPIDQQQQQQRFREELDALEAERDLLVRANAGGEYLDVAQQDQIRSIGQRRLVIGGQALRLLSEQELDALTVSRGTLTDSERLIINQHMVQTINMLAALPFPRDLRRVPEYACGHHEKMDGTGYPRGIFAGDMSIPARALAIADIFEALTAQDRPYKPGKSLSEAMRIMGFMKRDNHFDPDLFDLFVKSGAYRRYGEQHLPAEQVDAVDEAALLAIEPKPLELPSSEQRRARWNRMLPAYAALDEP